MVELSHARRIVMVITLDSSLDKPLYLQIRDQIRGRIQTGELKSGDRLEPTRELGKRLGVNRTTVGNAYAELEAEGLIQGTVGRGTFISPLAAALRQREPPTRQAGGDRFWESFFGQDSVDDSLSRLMASASAPGVISFASTRVPEELNIVQLVRRAADAVLRREGANLLQYGSSDGYLPLKYYLQARLRREGISVKLDQILITNGCQQSLDLLRRSLVGPGDVVACENPTYTGLSPIFETGGARLIGVPVEAEGMDLDFLTVALEQSKVRLILASPNFQNPTGRTMPLAARRRLIELATRFQVPVVEDDVYGALRFAGRELPSLKSLDASGLVIYLSSFSKVGFPGLRVGWAVASARVIERLRWAKQRSDLHTNLLGQAVLEELGQRGWLDKLIRQAGQVYARRLEVLRRAVGEHFPAEIKIAYPEGGMFTWAELPESLDAGDLLVKAQERGVVFAPSRHFYFKNQRHNALRLCFTSVADEKIEEAIRVLGQLLKEEIRKGRTEKKRAPAAPTFTLV